MIFRPRVAVPALHGLFLLAMTLALTASARAAETDAARITALQGSGRLDIHGAESKPSGLPQPEVKILPSLLVKQIARTPALDLNPELFPGLFEMRELDRLEQTLKDLQQARPGDAEVGAVAALYQRALKNVRQAPGG